MMVMVSAGHCGLDRAPDGIGGCTGGTDCSCTCTACLLRVVKQLRALLKEAETHQTLWHRAVFEEAAAVCDRYSDDVVDDRRTKSHAAKLTARTACTVTSLAAHRQRANEREEALAALRRWAMREQGARMRRAQEAAWWPTELVR